MDERDARLLAALEEAEDVALRDPQVALASLAPFDLIGLRSRDPGLAARIGYLRARLLALSGSYDEAMGAIRAARRDWLASGNALDALATDLGRATVLNDIGEHEQAVGISRTLLTRLTTAAVPPEREDDATSVRARAHHNLGNALSGTGDYDGALRHYDLAANLYSAIGWRRLQAETDANRGVTYLRLGLAHRALSELGAAVRALRAEGHEVAALRTEVDLAEAHLALDDAAGALWLLRAVRARLEERHAAPDLGRLAVVVARAFAEAGQPEQAHREAIAAYDRFTDLIMVGEAARAITIAAWSSLAQDELVRGRAEAHIALSLFGDAGNRPGEAAARLVLAQLEAREGRTRRAIELVRTSAAALESMQDNVTACRARLQLAELVSDPSEVRTHLDRAVELVQSLDVPVLHLRLALGRARHDRQRGDLQAAAGRLRAALLRSHRIRRGPLDASELEPGRGGVREEALAELLEVLLGSGTHADTVEAWRWANWARAEAAAELSASGDPRLAWDDPAVLAPLEGPVLQYHPVGDDVVAFVVRDAQIHARRLPGAVTASRRHLAAWESACALRRLGPVTEAGPGTAAADAALEALHALLVEPLADLLDDEPGAPWLVVAQGHLLSVPFEALHGCGTPLGLDHPLTFTAALTPYADPRPSAVRQGEESTLVLAVPDDHAPAILHDAMVITALRPQAEVYVGARATAEVLRERGAAHDLVHIASHGDFDRDRPLDSALALADGPLTGRDLRRLDLRGAVVFLAACDGGRSVDGPGGPAGLAWSTLAAGARTVLAATWSVDDAATSRFVRQLYGQIAAGRPFPAAVHEARLAVAAEDPDPYHWAAFRVLASPATALGDALTS